MTPRLSIIAAAIRKVIVALSSVASSDYYWDNVVLAMKMDTNIDPEWGSTVLAMPMDKDPHWNNVTLALNMEGLDNGSIFTDLKGSGVTGVNGALTKTGVRKVGSSSAYFNGSGSYLNIPTATIFDLSTSDFTIESWVYFNTGGTFGGAILSRRYDGANGWCIVCSASTIAWRAKINGTWQDGFCPTTGVTFETNKWYHVALERVGSVFTTYVDGIPRGTATLSGAIDDTTQPLRVGTATVATNETPFNGYIDNLRITKGAARYGRSFAIKDSSFLTDGILDLKSHSISAIGTPALSTAQSKFGGTSLLLNGTTDYLSIPTSPDFGFDTNNFTVECWVKTATSGTVLDLRSSSGELGLFAIRSGFISLWNGSTYLQGFTNVTTDAWVHLAWVRSAGVVSMFVNGVLDGVSATSLTFGTTRPVRIGADIAAANFFSGYIDDLRVSKVARYADEFTPATYKFLNGTAVPFLEEKGKAVTVLGNTSISTTTKQFGSGSANFDGAADQLEIADNADFAFGSNDFTIECWINLKSSLSVTGVVGQRSNSSLMGWSLQVESSNARFQYSVGGGIDGTVYNTQNLGLNAWYHLAIVRNGSVLTLFVGGVAGSSVTIGTAALYDASLPVWIGSLNQLNPTFFNFDGYIDDLRITKGVAKYISNFTPVELATNKRTYLDPHWDKVVLGLHMDGADNGTTFVEVKGRAVTTVGNTCTKQATKKFGTASAYFDGTGDYLTVPDSADFAFGSEDFTIEFWSNSTSSASFAVTQRNTNNGADAWYVIVGSTPTAGFSANGANWMAEASAPACIAAQWNHVAVVRFGTFLTMFVNGVAGTPVSMVGSVNNSLTNLSVGASADGAFPITGYIDDLRITKGVARYTANFQPVQLPFPEKAYDPVPYVSDPHWGSVVLGMHMDGADNGTTFTDVKGKTVVSVGGVVTKTNIKKFGSASMKVAVHADYLSIGSAPDLSSGDYTIEFWVYLNQPFNINHSNILVATDHVLASRWLIDVGHTSGQLNVRIATPLNAVVATYQGPHSLGTWAHIAYVNNTADSSFKVFLNGTQIGSRGLLALANSGPLLVGRNSPTWVAEAYYIDDLRITKGVGRYVADFTPPGRFPEVLPTFTPTQSRLVSAVAYSNNYGAGVNLRDNPAATGESTWPDFFSEFNSTAIFSYANGPLGAGSDTGTLGTYTIPFDPLDTYLLEANNASWSSDVCSFTLEFLNASNAVVACIKTTGTGSYRHDLYYGSSIADATTMAGTSGFNNTGGTLTFTATQMVFTNVRGNNYNSSFTFNCGGLTITQVRVSNVRANSTYTGNSSVFVRLYRQINV